MEIPSNTPLRSVPDDYCPPGAGRWFTLTDGYDAGKRLFYYDWLTAPGPPCASLLFVHGNPECSYTYRHIRDRLAASGLSLRIVMLDHIGFGLSDQADFEMVDMHHAANLLQLVQHLDLRDLTLVVHDWGGPIGLGALIQEHWRVSRLVVMNTTVFPMPATGLTYRNYPYPWLAWSWTPWLVPTSLWGGVAAYVVSHADPQAPGRFLRQLGRHLWLFARRRIPSQTAEYVWSEALRSRVNARSSKRNVRQTPAWGHGYRYRDARHGWQDNHAFYRRLQSEVPARWGADGRNLPAAGFFGQWDACGKREVIRQWHEALPAMQLSTWTFPDAGHFVEERKGADIADAMVQML